VQDIIGNKIADYTGSIKNGFADGDGAISYLSGARYNGLWQDGKKHGHGVYTYENGDTYEGEFDKNNIKNGPGIFIKSDGKKFAQFSVGNFVKENAEIIEGNNAIEITKDDINTKDKEINCNKIFNGVQVEMNNGDILKQRNWYKGKNYAIVNAGNSDTNMGSGAAGLSEAVHTYFGAEYLKNKLNAEAKKVYKNDDKNVPETEAICIDVRDGGYKQEGFTHIVHAVGVDFRDERNKKLTKRTQHHAIAETYKNAFNAAAKAGCKIISVPAISAGIFGGDPEIIANALGVVIADELSKKPKRFDKISTCYMKNIDRKKITEQEFNEEKQFFNNLTNSINKKLGLDKQQVQKSQIKKSQFMQDNKHVHFDKSIENQQEQKSQFMQQQSQLLQENLNYNNLDENQKKHCFNMDLQTLDKEGQSYGTEERNCIRVFNAQTSQNKSHLGNEAETRIQTALREANKQTFSTEFTISLQEKLMNATIKFAIENNGLSRHNNIDERLKKVVEDIKFGGVLNEKPLFTNKKDINTAVKLMKQFSAAYQREAVKQNLATGANNPILVTGASLKRMDKSKYEQFTRQATCPMQIKR
jgi:O-acetyl-ADP-ribose deacetylase (regulator of RNase III)